MHSLRDRWSQMIRRLRPGTESARVLPGDGRAALIERKAAVQAEAAQMRRELERLRSGGAGRSREAELEAHLGRLAAEERRLRLQIDRTRKDEDAPP